jgi:hypothetical protein
MLVLGKCRECGKVRPCIAFPWRSLKTGDSGINYYCPECDELIDGWLDRELKLQWDLFN